MPSCCYVNLSNLVCFTFISYILFVEGQLCPFCLASSNYIFILFHLYTLPLHYYLSLKYHAIIKFLSCSDVRVYPSLLFVSIFSVLFRVVSNVVNVKKHFFADQHSCAWPFSLAVSLLWFIPVTGLNNMLLNHILVYIFGKQSF